MNKANINKAIIFDAGTLISLSMNGLIDELRKLKKIFNGNFLITSQVKAEIIDNPLKIKQFELEALRTRKSLEDGILELAESLGFNNSAIQSESEKIMNTSNSLFQSSRGEVKIMHLGEASCIALSKMLNEKKIKNLIAIDERTTRMLIEKPENLKDLLSRKLHTNIRSLKSNFEYFKEFSVIRSVELVYVLWKKGLMELNDGINVLDALLYALKFKGCSVSSDEIEEIKRMK